MLEGLAALILNSYIGEYFGNVNTDQVSIALHQGEVELEGLPLKKDAFRHLGLPLEFKAGYIGKISLKIPVYRIRSEACSIQIEDLFLVAKPISNFTYNEEEEEQAMQDRKLSQLDAIEAFWREQATGEQSAGPNSGYYASSYSNWLGYVSSFITNIVDNLQLKIKWIHFRYEDDVTIPGQRFACGLVIHNLTALSTDDSWTPKYIVRQTGDTPIMRKLMELDGLHVYWDRDVPMLSDFPQNIMVAEMRRLARQNDTPSPGPNTNTDHADNQSDQRLTTLPLILAPVSGRTKLRRNLSARPLVSRSDPRITLDCQLDAVSVQLTGWQYAQVREWSDQFSRLNTQWKYRKWRPLLRPRPHPDDGPPAAWWHYAINAYLDPVRRRRARRNWSFVLQRVRDINTYCDIYYAYLIRPDGALGSVAVAAGAGPPTLGVTKEMKQERERIEQDFSFEELLALREVIYDKCKRDHTVMLDNPLNADVAGGSNNSNQSQTGSSWWSWWNRSTGAAPPSAEEEGDEGDNGRMETESSDTVQPSGESGVGSVSVSDVKDMSIASDSSCDTSRDTEMSHTVSTPPTAILTRQTSSVSSLTGLNVPAGNPPQQAHQDQSGASDLSSIIMPDNNDGSFLRRDVVFLKSSFSIRQATLSLCSTPIKAAHHHHHDRVSVPRSRDLNLERPFIELNLQAIECELETQPRQRSYFFKTRLGGLYVKDKLTPNPIAPNLIAPQIQSSSADVFGFPTMADFTPPSSNWHTPPEAMSPSSSSDQLHSERTTGEATIPPTSEHDGPKRPSGPLFEPLFELSYQRMPLNDMTPTDVAAKHELIVTSRPIDLAYNYVTFKACQDFFFNKFRSSNNNTASPMTEKDVNETSDQDLFGSDTTNANMNTTIGSYASSLIRPTYKFVFNLTHLNVLLVGARETYSPSDGTGGETRVTEQYKIATATMVAANVTAKMANELIFISGSLGGLKVVENLFLPANSSGGPAGGLTDRVIIDIDLSHMGRGSWQANETPTSSSSSQPGPGDLSSLLGGSGSGQVYHRTTSNSGLYERTSATALGGGAREGKAISFYIRRLLVQNVLEIHCRMASLCYTHSPILLDELYACLADFRNYVPTTLADRIKTEAADLATEIVAPSSGLDSKKVPQSVPNEQTDALEWSIIENLKVNVHIQSPVIIVPFDSHTLVARLGHIKIQNATTSSSSGTSGLSSSSTSMGNLRSDLIQSADLPLINGSDNTFSKQRLIYMEANEMSCYFVDSFLSTKSSKIRSHVMATNLPGGTHQQQQQQHPAGSSGLNIGNTAHSRGAMLDCDADVPLLQASINSVKLWQSLNKRTLDGFARLSVSCDYFNKTLSGWEPVLEPCNCQLEWNMIRAKIDSINDRRRLTFNLTAQETVNLNLTSDFMEIYYMIRDIWWYGNEPSTAYGRDHVGLSPGSGGVGGSGMTRGHSTPTRFDVVARPLRVQPTSPNHPNNPATESGIFAGRDLLAHRNAPTVPFALKNDTGCRISFAVISSQSSEYLVKKISLQAGKDRSSMPAGPTWHTVEVNGVKFFTFDSPTLTSPVSGPASLDGSSSGLHQTASLSSGIVPQDGEVKVRKVIIQVEGWKPVSPVTVDRLGTCYRDAATDDPRLDPARIVFDVTLDTPTGGKIITVRSALRYTNSTPNGVEVRFDQCPGQSLFLPKRSTKPVPLLLIRRVMRARPCDIGVTVSTKEIQWDHLRRQKETSCDLLTCHPSQSSLHSSAAVKSYSMALPYRMCAFVERENFPPDGSTNQGPGLRSYKAQPGHRITLMAPLQITNLLPVEIKYRIAQVPIKGCIYPGDTNPVPYVDTTIPIHIEMTFDNFPRARPLIISPGATRDYTVPVEVYDKRDRRLTLNAHVRVISPGGPAITVNLYAAYWFVNRTGLPVVFRQDTGLGNSVSSGHSGGGIPESAGQFEEHELARSIVPLMFNFSDPEHGTGMTVSMRLGRCLGNTRWCKHFYLEKGNRVRRLRISPHDSHEPDRIYEIGIDVRPGKGRFRDTQIVTFSPRYHIENGSSHRLELTQRFAVYQPPEKRKDWVISVLSSSSVAFHWPRADQDKLICVRLCGLGPAGQWSGGFSVAANQSFHLNIRDDSGRCHFIRVQILLQNATFFIIFTDASNLPPPIRIDNFSAVPIEFHQTGTKPIWMRARVRARSAFPYAWDEPTLKPYITACGPGNCCSTYDINSLTKGDDLVYENFTYLVMSSTLGPGGSGSGGGGSSHGNSPPNTANPLSSSRNPQTISYQTSYSGQAKPLLSPLFSEMCQTESNQLVLEVPDGCHGKRILLARREPGQRSQLWRYDHSSGRIIHEGSTPPTDYAQRRRSGSNTSAVYRIDSETMVLDVDSLCALPGEISALCLRKYDRRRSMSQTWRLTQEGRLVCETPHLCVQVMEGTQMEVGARMVLGPYNEIRSRNVDGKEDKNRPPKKMPDPIPQPPPPPHEAISMENARPGSGVLEVRVLADGPTRVLRITDKADDIPATSSGPQYLGHMWPSSKKSDETRLQEATRLNVQLFANIVGGLGVSIINHLHEELIHALLHNIIVDYSYNSGTEHILNLSVQNFQIDNQTADAEQAVVMYVTEQARTHEQFNLPAIQLSAHKLLIPDVDAHVFKHFQVAIKDVTFHLEEVLMFKVFHWLGWYLDEERERKGSNLYGGNGAGSSGQSDQDHHHHGHHYDQRDGMAADEMEEQCANRAILSALNKSARTYFSLLKIEINHMNLSVITSPHLGGELLEMKKKSGFKLIRFEDAYIQLQPFVRQYRLETIRFLLESIIDHYRMELKGQAARILGAVDFLGNPLGLMNDFSDGLNELITEGNVGGLMLNVAHGLSDSAAKFTSSLGDSLGLVTMDPRHQAIRMRIKQQATLAAGGPGSGSSSSGAGGVGSGGVSHADHLSTGLKGLGIGVFGGVTSLITQTYDGAANDGLSGFFTGLGKGLVGTFTKPAVGVLDLGSSVARIVRDSSRKVSSNYPIGMNRVRCPRQGNGLTSRLIQPYDINQAFGQQIFLTKTSDRDETEMFLSFETIMPDVALLISTERVRFLNWSENSTAAGSGSGGNGNRGTVAVLNHAAAAAPLRTMGERGRVILAIHYEQLMRCTTYKEFNNDQPGSGSGGTGHGGGLSHRGTGSGYKHYLIPIMASNEYHQPLTSITSYNVSSETLQHHRGVASSSSSSRKGSSSSSSSSSRTFGTGTSTSGQRHPKIRCMSEADARRLADQINFAKGEYEERKFTIEPLHRTWSS